MSDSLTLLTATGARPAAWAICERLMRAQDYRGPVRWIVVDDGPEPHPLTFRRDGWTVEILRPHPPWSPGQRTQARNLLAGLEQIAPDARVAIIEDDDWYGPGWLSWVARHFGGSAELVGEKRARYYHVALRRWKEHGNVAHASLCSSAVRGAGLDALRQACHAELWIDIALWNMLPTHRCVLAGEHRTVGIKGLPGRPGIGSGHRLDWDGTPDPDGERLRAWIGRDAAYYLGQKGATDDAATETPRPAACGSR